MTRPREATRCGQACCVSRIGDLTLTLNTRSNSSSLASSTVRRGAMPALWTVRRACRSASDGRIHPRPFRTLSASEGHDQNVPVHLLCEANAAGSVHAETDRPAGVDQVRCSSQPTRATPLIMATLRAPGRRAAPFVAPCLNVRPAPAVCSFPWRRAIVEWPDRL